MSDKCKPIVCSGCAANTVCIRDPDQRRCVHMVHHYENGAAWTASDVRAAINAVLEPYGIKIDDVSEDLQAPRRLGLYAQALLAVWRVTG